MPTDMNHALRINALRKLLKSENLQGLVIGRADEFLGEYVPASAERLKWLTGFTGSAGTAIIAPKATALIVDGRYTIQSARETAQYEPKILPPDAADLQAFLGASFRKGSRIGFDPWVTAVTDAQRLQKAVDAAGLHLVATGKNMVDAIWLDRPAPSHNPVYAHPLSLAGAEASAKIAAIAKELKSKDCDAVVLTDAHSVAWALNIRGSDVQHTPLPLVRCIVHANAKVQLFVEADRLEAKNTLGKALSIVSPAGLADALKALKSKRVWIDPALCPEAVRGLLKSAKAMIHEATDPCSFPRARKNKVEQKGTRLAHLRDGAALVNFLCWFDHEAPKGSLTERDAEQALLAFRQATGKLMDLSFGTIAASGPNAALPHYHATGKTGRRLRNNEIFLIDSGGQYRDGTTDVTRTIIVGTPTPTMKQHNTLVLKGMIAVSVARFPVGTNGIQLDALARQALWQHGYDFNHGTGHGVGSFLSVHEGPARISKMSNIALEPGMILSNEPGYYVQGKYGIRIENLLLVNGPAKPKGGNKPMLSFECLTFAPIDKRLIDETLLTRAEIQWLDSYHAEVEAKLKPLVNENARHWLAEACAPLTKNS